MLNQTMKPKPMFGYIHSGAASKNWVPKLQKDFVC